MAQIAPTIPAHAGTSSGFGTETDCVSALLVESPYRTAPTLVASGRGVRCIGDPCGQDPVVLHEGNSNPTTEARSLILETENGPSARGQAFGGNNTSGPIEVATACNAHGGSGRMDFESETFVVHGSQDPCVSRDTAFALGRNQGQENTLCILPLRVPGKDKPPPAVRRLTPIECERLQGFPDNWTLIPGRRQNFQRSEADRLEYLAAHTRISDPELLVRLAADGPRYKAIGNSMAIPVMRWIGERLRKAVARNADPA